MADNSIEIVARLDAKFDDFIKRFDALEGKVDKGAGKMAASFKKIGAGLKTASGMIIKGTAVIGGALAGVTGYLIKMGSDAEESENLFEVSFGNMSGAARKWSEEYSKALGVNQYESRKQASTLHTMITSMGASEEASYKMSTSLVELSNDMASYMNLKPEEAFEKLQAGISGEAEPLKRLGILINETSVQSYAMANGIGTITEKNGKMSVSLTEAEKVYARYGLIMERTKKAQGDLARTADSTANVFRRMKSKVEETFTSIGKMLNETFQWAIAEFAPKVEEAMDGLLAMVNDNKQAIQEWFAMILDKGVQAFGRLLECLKANKGEIAATAKQVFEFIQQWGGLIAKVGIFIVVAGQIVGPLTGMVILFTQLGSAVRTLAGAKCLGFLMGTPGSAIGLWGLAGLVAGGGGLIIGLSAIAESFVKIASGSKDASNFVSRFIDKCEWLRDLIDGLSDKAYAIFKWMVTGGPAGSAYRWAMDLATTSDEERLEQMASARGYRVDEDGNHQKMAIGGFSAGGLTLLGEHGPELAKLPRGTQVYRASQTTQMLAGAGGINITLPLMTDASPADVARAVGRELNRLMRRMS